MQQGAETGNAGQQNNNNHRNSGSNSPAVDASDNGSGNETPAKAAAQPLPPNPLAMNPATAAQYAATVAAAFPGNPAAAAAAAAQYAPYYTSVMTAGVAAPSPPPYNWPAAAGAYGLPQLQQLQGAARHMSQPRNGADGQEKPYV